MDAYENLVSLGRQKFGMSVKFKDESLFMKTLGILLFFNKDFMKNYITTIGSTVYFPSKQWLSDNKQAATRVMCHEMVHISDSAEVREVVFSYSYLFPQVLALLALCAIFGSPFWLLSLLFLLPIPAPGRTYWELRGYALTDAVEYKTTGKFSDIDWLTGQFTTSKYYFMWPFNNDIRERVLLNRDLILKNQLSDKIEISSDIMKCFDNQ